MEDMWDPQEKRTARGKRGKAAVELGLRSGIEWGSIGKRKYLQAVYLFSGR